MKNKTIKTIAKEKNERGEQAREMIYHLCSICKNEYTGFGNNADPVNDGRCCDFCNNHVVLMARLRIMNNNRPKSCHKI